jgi:DNA-binding transcriptional LysR family regulator
MELHQVRYFLAVCEELNFTRAASKCHVTQPSLTRAIKLLEAEFGGLLFHRLRPSAALTELGKVVHPYLQSIWDQTTAARSEARAFVAARPTQLKLAIMCTIAPKLLIRLFERFRAAHPDIRLELIDGTAVSVEERLIVSETEAAIYCRPDRPPDPRLHRLPLFREQMMIVLPQSHRLADRRAIRVEDLQGDSYVERSACEFNGVVDDIFIARGVDCDTVYRSDRDDWVLAMIASGFGFGFFPHYSIEHAGVVAVPMVDPEFFRDVSLVTVKGRPHSPAVGAFLHEAMRAVWPDGTPAAVQTYRHSHD